MSNNAKSLVKEKSGKELAELKRENGQLKRKVSKLQRQLQKALEGLFNDDDEEVRTPIAKEKKNDGGCPECGSVSLKSVSIPTGSIITCTACKWHKFKAAGHDNP